MKKIAILFVLSAGILSACGLITRRGFAPSVPMPSFFSNQTFASNGEQIYLTGTNSQGDYIRYSGGPGTGGMMMGAYLTCAACHGADGRGGIHTMHMQVMDAPDIRFQALSGEEGDHVGDDHGEGEEEYSVEVFRQAVVQGQHPDGERLSRDMPRWQLSDEDLSNLFDFLKTLP